MTFDRERLSVQLLGLAACAALGLVSYLVGIFVYALISTKPTFFFASCVLALIIPMLQVRMVRSVLPRENTIALILYSFSCGMLIVLFGVFGPVFIDRSISYHVVLYAVEHGELDRRQFQPQFADAMFEKRIQDAQLAGFLTPSKNEKYIPTRKARIFATLFKTLGSMTKSINNYNLMKRPRPD